MCRLRSCRNPAPPWARNWKMRCGGPDSPVKTSGRSSTAACGEGGTGIPVTPAHSGASCRGDEGCRPICPGGLPGGTPRVSAARRTRGWTEPGRSVPVRGAPSRDTPHRLPGVLERSPRFSPCCFYVKWITI